MLSQIGGMLHSLTYLIKMVSCLEDELLMFLLSGASNGLSISDNRTVSRQTQAAVSATKVHSSNVNGV